jgi:sugar O-acyltransferase (sialic acid O-acetyltransferase NeuD family)
MKPILIFGSGKIADVIAFYMKEVSQLPLLGFVVDDKFLTKNQLNGLPIISYSECLKTYKPDEVDFFVAVGYHDLNRVRAKMIQKIKSDGYSLISYIHPDAGIPSDLEYGENTFIMDKVLIHPRVKLGADNFIWSGTMLGHHSQIGNHNWFTSSCQISGNVSIGDFNFFAVNSTVGHSVTIGNENFFGANTLITKNVSEKQVFIEESTKVFRLNSDQFLRFSNFGSL